MTFKSDFQPRCRWCGKPIRKDTHAIRFGQAYARQDTYGTSRTERPATRAEAQLLLNWQITAIRYDDRASVPAEREGQTRTVNVERYISEAYAWDGESYQDEFFDSGDCAKQMGNAAARKGLVTDDYNAAIKKKGA